MIKKKGQPISGGARNFRPTPNVLSDAADTSRDAQKLIRATPQPFQNRQGAADVPTGRLNTKSLGITYDNPSPVNAKPQNWGTRVAPGTTAAMLRAAGEPRAPKGYNPIISGYPTRGVQRTVGGGNQPSAKEVSRIKKTYPGLGIGKWQP